MWEGRDMGMGTCCRFIRWLHVTTVGFIDAGADGQTDNQQHSSQLKRIRVPTVKTMTSVQRRGVLVTKENDACFQRCPWRYRETERGGGGAILFFFLSFYN